MSVDAAPKKLSIWSRISGLAHPGQFMAWSGRFVLPLAILTAIAFAAGLWLSFFASPGDYQMGDTVRIMYIHVPNAVLCQGVLVLMAIAALGTLVWRHPMADVTMKAAAPLGAAFTAMALFTGSLWGRPTWGTFWEWDGRMTSTLVMLLIYLGIIALWRAFDDQLRAARLVAVVTLVGVINVPIVKFSVDWWGGLHQPASLIRAGGTSIAPSMLSALLTMMVAFGLLFVTLQLVRMRSEVTNRKVAGIRSRAALGASR